MNTGPDGSYTFGHYRRNLVLNESALKNPASVWGAWLIDWLASLAFSSICTSIAQPRGRIVDTDVFGGSNSVPERPKWLIWIV